MDNNQIPEFKDHDDHHQHEGLQLIATIRDVAKEVFDSTMNDPVVISNIEARAQLRNLDKTLFEVEGRLRLTPRDVLCRPIPIGQSEDALLLTRPVSLSDTSYMLLVNTVRNQETGELDVDCTIFRPRFEDSTATGFMTPNSVLMAEIKRQVNVIYSAPGPSLLCMRVFPGYFRKLREAMNEPAPEEAQHSPLDETPAAEAVQYAPLPEVVHL